MKKLPKLFLIVSIISFVAGAVVLCIPNLAPAWTVGIPLGAVFLGLFLIALMLQNEMALFDEEERSRLEQAKRWEKPVAAPSPAKGRQEPAFAPALH